jgi:isoprenylcysteine carboxyl methyltransferase (ICMT) family protein YpbQ
MSAELSRKEEKFVRDLLTWDRTERSSQRVFFHLFLFIGLAVFVTTAYYTLRNMNDRTILWVLFPGGLIACLFFVVYAVGERWATRRHSVASVLKKLGSET